MATNQRFEGRRRLLLDQEREVRASLRVQLDRGDSANAAQVATLLDRMLQVQRDRLAVTEQEQRELAAFLTPMQRARLLGLQEQIRQRIEGMRLPPGAGPGGMPPRGRGGEMLGAPPRAGRRPPQDAPSFDRP